MNIRLLLFATLKDAAGAAQLDLELPGGASVADAKTELAKQRPRLESWLPHVRVAVNQEYVADDHTLEANDEVALIPPVSGGAGPDTSPPDTSPPDTSLPEPLVAVVERELSLDEVVNAARREKGVATGAVCTFLGVVRAHSVAPDGARHDDIAFLDYEAYVPMAEKEMRRIAVECRERWNVACAITHRVGRLEVGEASVAIAVASAHRAEALKACRHAIETLKKRVPIWKKETTSDGFWWVEGSGME